MTLDASGNLGVGTSTPSDTYNYGKALDLQSSAGAAIYLRDSDATSNFGFIAYDGGTTNRCVIGGGGTAYLRFISAGAECGRFDASGNVGIGVVPNAGWNSTYKAIQVGNAGAVWSEDASSSNTLISNNEVYNTNGSYYRLVAGAANDILLQNNGSFQFRSTATSAAANSIISDQTTKMTLDASGNLLVGTTSNIVNNNARVAIVGAEGLRAQATSGGGTSCIAAFATSSGGTYYYVGYDLDASTIKYQVLFNGNVQNTNNSYGGISDAKLKENVTDATPKLEKLNQVRVVNFNLIGDEQKQIGVIAQELEQIFPSMVEDNPDFDAEGNDLGTTTKSVKYSVFVPMLIKAMQEQQATIEALTARIAALES